MAFVREEEGVFIKRKIYYFLSIRKDNLQKIPSHKNYIETYLLVKDKFKEVLEMTIAKCIHGIFLASFKIYILRAFIYLTICKYIQNIASNFIYK